MSRYSVRLNRTIKALCITEDADRPTTATFVGLRRAGVDLSVICPRSSESRAVLIDAGVPVLDLEIRKRFDLSGIRRLREELERGRYDILHVFSNKALQNGLLAARGIDIRIVAYRGIVGNVSFFSPVSWLRFLNPRIDRIVCVADAVRDYFLSMRPAFLRMPAQRVVRIYKGHSLDWYTAAPANLNALGITDDAFVVACVANYRPRKGIELLVDALADLPRDWQVHLLLVGGGMDVAGLTKRITASPLADRIHRLGYRKDAPSLTAACDVFVLPSIKREGLARSLLEAMAYGVAPIVTASGGSPEVVVDGVSGIVVPVRDAAAIGAAIRRLHEDPALRRRMGEAARERIRTHFRIEDTIEQTLGLYRSLVESPGA
jgi:glycosyltransferase involved in cell wall biosynthesis